MAYAKATLVREIRSILNDNPFTTACTEAMDTTETGLDVASTTKFDVGDIVEFTDDGERCLVTALASSTELTVIRNYDASSGSAVGTGTSHSSGVLVVKNPIFPFLSIVDTISETIYELWPYVYKKVEASITPVAGTRWYEIDEAASNSTEILELSSVVQDVDSKPFWYGTRRTSYPVRLHFEVPTTIAGSGVAIEIPYLKSTTNAIKVKGIGRITPTLATTNYADFSAGVGANTIKYLTVANMIERTGISRVTQDDITMTDESVRPMTREAVASYWREKGIRERNIWKMELDRTLPRKLHKAGDFS
jgi:hypothetical protein